MKGLTYPSVLVCLFILLRYGGCAKPPRCLVLAPSVIPYGESFKAYVILVGVKNVDVTLKLDTDTESQQPNPVKKRIQNEQPTEFSLRLTSLPERDAEKRYYVTLRTTLSSPAVTPPEPLSLLVTLRKGHVFVQLVKLSFKPGDRVSGYVYSVDDDLRPLQRDLIIDIVNPEKTISLRPRYHRDIKKFEGSLPPDAPEGIWEVHARYGQQKSIKNVFQFQVKKEVPELMVADVKIDELIYPSTDSINVEVEARYLSGSGVIGMAEVQLFFKDASGETPVLQGQIPSKDLENGKAKFVISTSLLKNGSMWFPTVDRQQLVVKALVLDQLTGYDVRKAKATAMFTKSPYVIDLSQTSTTFRPGLPYTLKGDVYDNFGNLQVGVQYVVKGHGAPIRDRSGSGSLASPILQDITIFSIETADDSLPADKQAHGVLTVKRFQQNASTPHIVVTGTVEAGNKYQSTVRFTSRKKTLEYQNIYYMVTSQDKIVKLGFVSLDSSTTVLAMPKISVNSSLSPGFHLTAFYLNTAGALIVDSLWQTIEHTCQGVVNAQLQATRVEPNGIITMNFNGVQGTTIHTFILDKRQTQDQEMMITTKKINMALTKNLGNCRHDGGRNQASMFFKAGVSVSMAGGGLKAPVREGQVCKVRTGHHRYRRYANEVEEDDIYEAQKYASFDQAIVTETIRLDASGTARIDVSSRSSPGIWRVYFISFSSSGLCVGAPLELRSRHDTGREMLVSLPDEIHVNRIFEVEALVQRTTFAHLANEQVNASLMVSDGMCSKTRPKKFSPLKPISFAGNKGTVSWPMVALTPGKHEIQVYFQHGEDLKSVVKKTFVVEPEGRRREEEQVMILGMKGLSASNLPHHSCFNITLNNYIKDQGIHTVRIQTKAPQGAILGSTKLKIGVITEPLGLVVTDILTKGISVLVGSEPIGCGEQAMVRIGPTVFSAKYLKPVAATQMDKTLEVKAKETITEGIIYMERFRNADGSYSTWPKKSPSTWLTAYVVKIFSYATEFSDGNPNGTKPLKEMICDSVNYVIQRQRSQDGAFPDPLGIVFTESVAGGLEGVPATTAYVTIALLELKKNIPACATTVLETAIGKAVGYLRHHATNTTDAFTLSMISYALTLADDSLKHATLDRLMSLSTKGKERRFWKFTSKDLSESQRINLMRDPVLTVEIETAAYTLLSLLHSDRLRDSHSVAAWLIYQHKINGRFISTQDTVIGLQALTLYRSNTPQSAIKMQVTSTSIDSGDVFHFKTLGDDNRNLIQANTYEVPDSDYGEFAIESTGEGQARLEISCTHYTKVSTSERCKFNMQLKLTDYFTESVNKQSKCSEFMEQKDSCFEICFSHPSGTSNMAVLWFNLHELQTANTDSVQKSVSTASIVDNVEINPRNVVFYLRNIPSQEHCLTFVGKSKFEIPQDDLPISYQIFDYHDRDRVRCQKHYIPNPYMTNRQPIIRITYQEAEKTYICAEKSPPLVCDFVKGQEDPSANGLSLDKLREKMCRSVPPMDYAYRVTFVTLEEEADGETCYLLAEIKSIVKNGTYAIDPSYNLKYKIDCAWAELREWALQTAKDDIHLVVGELSSVLDVNYETRTIILTLNEENVVQRLLARRRGSNLWKTLPQTIKSNCRKINKKLKSFQCLS